MRILMWIGFSLLISMQVAFSEDVDLKNLARDQRVRLAGCMSDSLAVIEKHKLGFALFDLWGLFDAACGMEIEEVEAAARNQLKDDLYKKVVPGQLILGMVENARELYQKRSRYSCSGDGCILDDYRSCLMQKIPTAIRMRQGPINFEHQAGSECEGIEGVARSILTNDFNDVQKRHLAGSINHKMNEAIRKIIAEARQAVVVLYAEDLRKVQPNRKSCKPEMCGASPCISLDEETLTEYQCVINQK